MARSKQGCEGLVGYTTSGRPAPNTVDTLWEDVPLEKVPVHVDKLPSHGPIPDGTGTQKREPKKLHVMPPSSKIAPTPPSESRGLPYYPRPHFQAMTSSPAQPSTSVPASQAVDMPGFHIGSFSLTPFPGLKLQAPASASRAGDVIIGYKITHADVGCARTDTLSTAGWVVIVLLCIVFFPLAFMVCWLPGFHELVQRPVYDSVPEMRNKTERLQQME